MECPGEGTEMRQSMCQEGCRPRPQRGRTPGGGTSQVGSEAGSITQVDPVCSAHPSSEGQFQVSPPCTSPRPSQRAPPQGGRGHTIATTSRGSAHRANHTPQNEMLTISDTWEEDRQKAASVKRACQCSFPSGKRPGAKEGWFGPSLHSRK